MRLNILLFIIISINSFSQNLQKLEENNGFRGIKLGSEISNYSSAINAESNSKLFDLYINNNFYNFSNNVNYVLDIRNDKNFESIDYEPNLLKRKYISTPATEVEHYCSDIYGVYPIENQTKQEITFLTSIDVTNYFEAYPIHPSQKAEKNNSGSSFFIINVIPSMELIRLFRSYGKHLEVINPDWLRQQTKSLK